MRELLTILEGDALEQLRTLPAESVHCCVTSPPYWGLRDYGTAAWEGGDDGCDHVEIRSLKRDTNGGMLPAGEGTRGTQSSTASSTIQFRDICGKCGARRIDSQLGLEKTPEEYVAKMVEIFREVRRVLRRDGTLWLNLGDSYTAGHSDWSRWKGGQTFKEEYRPALNTGLKPKDLCGIPWRVAFALQADGWWLRSDIIWAKPNPMPESVTDRPTKAHEYLFLLTKSENYFYDAEAIKEQSLDTAGVREVLPDGSKSYRKPWVDNKGRDPKTDLASWASKYGSTTSPNGRNKRSVWTVATAPYREAHFATFPPDLIKPCIMAGTSAKGCCAKCGAPWERIVERGELIKHGTNNYPTPMKGTAATGQFGNRASNMTRDGFVPSHQRETKTLGWQPNCKCCSWHEPKDRVYCVNHPEGFFAYKAEHCTVLDPFAGSGTTGAVALELGRKAILIELNSKYVQLIRDRCNITPGLALA